MNKIEQKVLKIYIPHETTLRDVGRKCNINHHRVKRILVKNNIKIMRGRLDPLTDERKKKISKSCKGKISWIKGLKVPKNVLYKNMATHLRFDVDVIWLMTFKDIEKLKTLNKRITNRSHRFDCNTKWYINYIEKFYNDKAFCIIYNKWLKSGKKKYRTPSIDHIIPKSKGGTNNLNNIQFLTWFENRCKNDMSQKDWNNMKHNIKDYFVQC